MPKSPCQSYPGRASAGAGDARAVRVEEERLAVVEAVEARPAAGTDGGAAQPCRRRRTGAHQRASPVARARASSASTAWRVSHDASAGGSKRRMPAGCPASSYCCAHPACGGSRCRASSHSPPRRAASTSSGLSSDSAAASNVSMMSGRQTVVQAGAILARRRAPRAASRGARRAASAPDGSCARTSRSMAALGAVAVARVAGALPQREQEADGAGRDVVVERGAHAPRSGTSAEQSAPSTGISENQPPDGELRGQEDLAGPAGGVEVGGLAGETMPVEQQRSRRRASRDCAPPAGPRSRGRAGAQPLGDLHHLGVGMRPTRGPRRERPAATRALLRDDRVERGREGGQVGHGLHRVGACRWIVQQEQQRQRRQDAGGTTHRT